MTPRPAPQCVWCLEPITAHHPKCRTPPPPVAPHPAACPRCGSTEVECANCETHFNAARQL